MVALGCTLFLGCTAELNPFSLMRPPYQAGEKKDITQIVNSFLPSDTKLVIPLNPEKASAFKLFDIDGNGKEEIIFFHKNLQNSYELGVTILEEKEGQWMLREKIKNMGQDIDYADFRDVTGDELPELIVGWSGGKGYNSELTVYSLQKNSKTIIDNKKYQYLATGDLNDDGKNEIVIMLRNEKEIPGTEVQLYQYVDGKLQQTDMVEFEGSYPGQITIGKATESRQGIFVEIGVGAHSAFTQLLVLENGQLKSVIKQYENDLPITFKPYGLYSKDVDDDGIIEIGMQTQPPGSEHLAMVEITWINNWYKWNGKANLIWVKEEVSDYYEGYQFDIPKNWHNKYTLIKRENEKERVMDFYFIGSSHNKRELLLSIISTSREDWLRKEKTLTHDSYSVLGEINNNVLIVQVPTKYPELTGALLAEYKKMVLSIEEFKECFQFINLF